MSELNAPGSKAALAETIGKLMEAAAQGKPLPITGAFDLNTPVNIVEPTTKQHESFEELGKAFANIIHARAYAPIQPRSVRWFFAMQKASGNAHDRAEVNAEFKQNSEIYAKLAGEEMLIQHLNGYSLFRNCAIALQIPVEAVLFSQAVAHFDRCHKMKVMLSLAGDTQMQKMPQVICGFPGVGKSTLFTNRGDQKILDSDSSTFDKANFPANYIAHIKEKIAEGYTILASTHDVVRQALVDNEIEFGIVYPALNCKAEYLQRYADRGNPQGFIDLMESKWVDFVNGCAAQKGCVSYCMPQGKYMPTIEELPKLLS